MGLISERIADIARRCGDLSPIQGDVRAILVEDNRQRALQGVDAQGGRFASLAPSTIRSRQGAGPPLAPRFGQSREITGYVVQVTAGPGRLTFVASWPGSPWMEYHHTGTRRMPRRDPYGFRSSAIDRIRPLMADYVMTGEVKGNSGGTPTVTAAPSAPQLTLLQRGRQRVAQAARSVFGWPRRRMAGA